MISISVYVDFTDICGMVNHLTVFIHLKLLDAQHGEKLFISVTLNVIVTTKGSETTVLLTGIMWCGMLSRLLKMPVERFDTRQ